MTRFGAPFLTLRPPDTPCRSPSPGRRIVYGDTGPSLYRWGSFFGLHAVPPTYRTSGCVPHPLRPESRRLAELHRAGDAGRQPGESGSWRLCPRAAAERVGARPTGISRALLNGDGMITRPSHPRRSRGSRRRRPCSAVYLCLFRSAGPGDDLSDPAYGTHRGSVSFGPVMIVWFVTLAVLGSGFCRCLRFRGDRPAPRLPSSHRTAGRAIRCSARCSCRTARSAVRRLGPAAAADRVRVVCVRAAALVITTRPGAMLLAAEAAPQVFFRLPRVGALPLSASPPRRRSSGGGGSTALISGAFSLTPRRAAWLRATPHIDHTSAADGRSTFRGELGAEVCTIAIVIASATSSRVARPMDRGHIAWSEAISFTLAT